MTGNLTPILFRKLLNSLISKGNSLGIHIPNEVLCQRIAGNLTGPYKPISDFYRMNYGMVSLEDILDQIQRTYISLKGVPHSHKDSTPSAQISTPKPQPKTCEFCDKRGHTAKKCPQIIELKAASERNSTARSKPTKKGGNKRSHVHHLNSTVPPEDLQCLRRASQPTELNINEFFVLDSAAEISVVSSKLLHNRNDDPPDQLFGAGNEEIPVAASGNLTFKWLNSVSHCIYAIASPYVDLNLVSTNDLEAIGVIVDNRRKALVKVDTDEVLAPIIKIGKYQCVPLSFGKLPKHKSQVHALSKKFPLTLVHRLFGHINVKDIRKSIESKLITNIRINDVDWSGIDKFQCKDCLAGKITKHKHIVGSRLKYQKSYEPFEYIHTDLFGPVSGVDITSPKYFISFTDENTRFRWVFPLKKKDADHILPIFQQLVNYIKNQFKVRVLTFHMDRGSEYTNKLVRDYFKDKGILPIYTTVGDSSSNGIAERANLTFLNDCRTLLSSSKLPANLWFYAVDFATLMRNAFINSSTNSSARAKAGLAGLDARTILPFGQEVMVHDYNQVSKLKPRGITGFALTPSKESHGYLIFIPSIHKVIDTSNYALVINDSKSLDSISTGTSVFDTLLEDFHSNEDELASIGAVVDNVSDDVSGDGSDDDSGNGSDDTDMVNADVTEIPVNNVELPAETDKVTTTVDVTPNKATVSTDAVANDIEDTNDPINVDEIINDGDNNTASSVSSNIEKTAKHNNADLSTTPSSIASMTGDDLSKSPTTSANTRSDSIAVDLIENQLLDSQYLSNLGGTEKGGKTKIQDMIDGKEMSSLAPYNTKRHVKPKKKRSLDEILETGEDVENPPRRRHRIKNIRINRINAVNKAVGIQHTKINPSLNYFEAVSGNDNVEERNLFSQAYHKEIEQLENMNTWDDQDIKDESEVDSNKVINTMFIFTTKRNGKKKCRCVARGDQQKPGTFNEDATSSTVHHYALMTCLAIALDKGQYITQLDISSAYLYAALEEELYIRTPPHMKMKGKVMRLNKSLYGLKQSGANWYNTIREFLLDNCDLTEVTGWPCVFTNNNVTVCLFVDDMVVFSKDLADADKLVDTLQSKFDTKVVHSGELINNSANYDILGLEVEYKFNEHMKFGMEESLSDKLTKLEVSMDTTKSSKTPSPPNYYIQSNTMDSTDENYYKDVNWLQRIVGLASYVAHKYRFDLLYYVNVLAQHTLFPNKEVKRLAKQLVKYMFDTRSKKLLWKKQDIKDNNLTALTDAAFANMANFKSQIGNFIILNGKIIGGKSSKEKLACTSSTEAELYSVSEAYPMLLSLQELVQSIKAEPIHLKIITDSKPVIALIQRAEMDDKKFRTRYFGARASRLRDELDQSRVSLHYIDTETNIADCLTKPLSIKKFNEFTKTWIN
ncbi:uncharacterized protein NDAI_0B06160 [Naumovozyma dairenensis CBS 421]|uniref:Uncharacterized protein n=1 Tax=Naumovozyma dairenensis (strain ATCC 10597 / BCRC 20456 / CBS 421 / NBRC 0211 / NRRL Y-12639) TaxID=1071378 RepID=G0W787_NAUDC|nr:hypothetical protein NDAI_0B06160 [Naumovozyma dairenensis CBS 421]CCD23648.1 hypothetical protein NDAI_0B06160 [Naumovozyma dairenensis CBS 421]